MTPEILPLNITPWQEESDEKDPGNSFRTAAGGFRGGAMSLYLRLEVRGAQVSAQGHRTCIFGGCSTRSPAAVLPTAVCRPWRPTAARGALQAVGRGKDGGAGLGPQFIFRVRVGRHEAMAAPPVPQSQGHNPCLQGSVSLTSSSAVGAAAQGHWPSALAGPGR